MKISIVNNETADKFSLIITNLHRFCESVILHFKSDKFYIQGMDFTQVALFEECLGSDDFFDVYDINDNDSDNVGIRTAILQKIFNTRDVGQPISMNYNGEPDNIEISFGNKKDDTKYIPKYFTIPLIEIEQTMLSIPDSDYPIEFSIPTKTFSTLVAQLLGFGDEIKFKCNEELINIKSMNYEGSMTVTLLDETNEYISEFLIEEETNTEIKFSNKFFTHFCAFSKLSQEVALKLSDSSPMQMKYNISEHSFMRFYLAPLDSD